MPRTTARRGWLLAASLLTGALAAACSSGPAPHAAPSSSPLTSAAPGSGAPASPTSAAPTSGSPTTAAPAPSTPRRTTAPPPPATSNLTTAQLVGQRIVYSYPGLTPPASLLQRIRAGQVAGVIFFGQNVSSAAQLRSAVATLRSAQQASPVHQPLLLMTDQEGGIVRRVPGAPLQSAKEIGATGDPAQAAPAGSAAGVNLRGLGLNLNLAPVLDVYHSPGDFADSAQRSFSSDPATVASMGSAFIRAQQQAGAAATAKHFPGLGAAGRTQNTDLEPVTINESLTRLRQVDEAPYPSAIAAGVRLVMLSWAVYPALDGSHPAGLSPTVVQELRGRLGFGGVTITDALEAKALTAYGSTGNRALAAVSAGMDLLLCSSQSVSQGDAAAQALVSALDSGRLNRAAFAAAAARVTALRSGLG
ncbi:glycoside hydrolase family 3 N-terminal domain-containing protein [Streptacidiphilus monticola]|uniref:Glycoside hydrolase family 3 N-terminal domain-containing protein n=1 Tax=Streptacidiphilus monticola TaxID=2161674 RepID=A0ABW1FZU5_9ACTN